MLGILDGTVLPADQVQIPATDEGLLRGDGVFEVMRLYDGRPFAVDDHLERMAALGAQPAAADRRRAPSARTSTRCSRRARPTATACSASSSRAAGGASGSSSRSRRCPTRSRCKTITYVADAHPRRRQVAVLRGEHARDAAGRGRAGADEALLVTPHGRVLEAPTSSFFCSLDGAHARDAAARATTSSTRSPGGACCGRATSRERPITADELAGVQEAFLASTVREVLPVHAIDGRALARRRRADARRRRAHARADRAGARRRRRAAASTPCGSSRSSGTGRSSSRPPRSRACCATSTRSCSSTPASTTTTSCSTVFVEELGVPRPERELGIHGGTNTEQTARMLAALAPLLADGARRTSCSSTATRTRRSPAGSPRRRRASRSPTSRPGCGRSTARCPRSSTAS